jgi:hypothetical protein
MPETPAESVKTDGTRQTDLDKEGIGLKSDHTTPAHQLMEQWPSMRGFCKGVRKLERLEAKGYKISDYVMQLEQNRGLIRVWGVSEGIDPNGRAQSSPTEDPDMDAPSPVPVKERLWGPLDASSLNTFTMSTPENPNGSQESPGALRLDGTLKINHNHVKGLLQSYMKNIHNLHPFLNPKELRKMVGDFVDTYDVSSNRTVHAGVKRKRSATSYSNPYSLGSAPSSELIEKSLQDAIVLLVLALGKVADYKDPLPSPDQDQNLLRDTVWRSAHGPPYSVNNNFSSNSGAAPGKRNIDKLPGMAYFRYATDILANHIGGNTVIHAQANILAALYISQYARVLECWSWINCACRICCVLIKA